MFSKTIADAPPPPLHIAATPIVPLFCLRISPRVPVIRAPELIIKKEFEKVDGGVPAKGMSKGNGTSPHINLLWG